MTLTLTMVASPDAVFPRSRQVKGGSFSLGRAPENDWCLPDAERHLSKRHCLIRMRNGYCEVADLSTNGTFLNDEDDPIGQGQVRDLRDGDRLRLGGYEFALRIAEADRSIRHAPLDASLDASLDAPGLRPLRPPMPQAALLIENSVGADSFIMAVQPDHSPGIEDAFTPPHPVVLLDDEWDLEASSAAVAQSVAPPPALTASVVNDPPPQAVDPGLLAAFLRGAGLPGATPSDPAVTMEALGATFRAMVRGLRETLIARAAIKDEFRIAQTVIRSRGNNPLKFSASDDDAMLALLGTGRRTDMGAADAMQEALRDIRNHELATMAAMQSAARALLREFNPAKLRDAAGGGGLLAQQRKARAWDSFETLHARLTHALSDDFDSAFGRAFARAYEQAQQESGG
jgi:type VI secretion system FHA domain protein